MLPNVHLKGQIAIYFSQFPVTFNTISVNFNCKSLPGTITPFVSFSSAQIHLVVFRLQVIFPGRARSLPPSLSFFISLRNFSIKTRPQQSDRSPGVIRAFIRPSIHPSIQILTPIFLSLKKKNLSLSFIFPFALIAPMPQTNLYLHNRINPHTSDRLPSVRIQIYPI